MAVRRPRRVRPRRGGLLDCEFPADDGAGDVCVGEWVVDCVDYDEAVTPDMLIIARRKSGRTIAFLLKIIDAAEKLGILMRALDHNLVEKSIFSKVQIGSNVDLRLVLAKPLDEGTVHMILQLIPVLSMAFLLTGAAGSALWVVKFEQDGNPEALVVSSQSTTQDATQEPYEDDPV